MSASQYSPFLKSNEVSEAGIEIIQSGETASVWTMHLSGTQAFLVPDPFENLEDLLKLQNWNKILSSVVLQMLKLEVFFGNSDHCGMLELPQKIVFLMVYWWWWVCDVSTKNGPHKLVFFLVVIGGAILLSASKIFACKCKKMGSICKRSRGRSNYALDFHNLTNFKNLLWQSSNGRTVCAYR